MRYQLAFLYSTFVSDNTHLHFIFVFLYTTRTTQGQREATPKRKKVSGLFGKAPRKEKICKNRVKVERVTLVRDDMCTPPARKCELSPLNNELLQALEKKESQPQRDDLVSKTLFSTPSPVKRKRERDERKAKKAEQARLKKLQESPSKYTGAECVQQIIDQAKQNYVWEGFPEFGIDYVEKHLAELGIDVDADMDALGEAEEVVLPDFSDEDEESEDNNSLDSDEDPDFIEIEGILYPRLPEPPPRERPPPPIW